MTPVRSGPRCPVCASTVDGRPSTALPFRSREVPVADGGADEDFEVEAAALEAAAYGITDEDFAVEAALDWS